jgi:murein DD-endopeptidase MepM/ murein hydrolase activator NlpD
MHHYIKISLPALAVLLVVGILNYSSNTSTAHANADINRPAPLLTQIADSLRNVSVRLDATIAELVAENNTITAQVQIPVASATLRSITDSLAAYMLPDLAPIAASHTDAFELQRRIQKQHEVTTALTGRIAEYQKMMESIPTLIPCEGEETSGFGGRVHPIFGVHKMHTGIDIAAPTGTPIYAAAQGVVVFAGQKSGYGNVVEIDHGYGYHTLYGHSSKLLVEAGDTISRGDKIALVGSTGNSTGSHLHYETIVNDQKINPAPFLLTPRVATVTPVKMIAQK